MLMTQSCYPVCPYIFSTRKLGNVLQHTVQAPEETVTRNLKIYSDEILPLQPEARFLNILGTS